MLPSIRFVITLDSDTELPRGSARRMVGALAHPLNQAIVDPEKGVVVTGYGILGAEVIEFVPDVENHYRNKRREKAARQAAQQDAQQSSAPNKQ